MFWNRNLLFIIFVPRFSQVIAGFFPLLLVGLEEDLVHLLKEDNEALKEGIAHVLAKAGGTIREQLAMTKRFDQLN